VSPGSWNGGLLRFVLISYCLKCEVYKLIVGAACKHIGVSRGVSLADGDLRSYRVRIDIIVNLYWRLVKVASRSGYGNAQVHQQNPFDLHRCATSGGPINSIILRHSGDNSDERSRSTFQLVTRSDFRIKILYELRTIFLGNQVRIWDFSLIDIHIYRILRLSVSG